MAVRAFKKGPDYIDAGWLTWASGSAARNLDTYLMGFPGALGSFMSHALPDGVNMIEGNRGLYDGSDWRGIHSTAELAIALEAPVVLVIDATKTTRTTAACVLGCQNLDPRLCMAGVIVNRVSSLRHQQVIRKAIESECGIPVLGCIPRIPGEPLIPERHMGLVTTEEHPSTVELKNRILETVSDHLDLERLFSIAKEAPPLPGVARPKSYRDDADLVSIGYIKDSAFSFYYPENLEALEEAGAKLIPIPSLAARRLPDGLDGLYIGGGFPETHAKALSANRAFLTDLKGRASEGLPVYAECGGLILLCRAIRMDGFIHRMSGVLPFEVEVCPTPQGHGYVCQTVDEENPFFPIGTEIKGHEFHYSRIVLGGEPPATACAVRRGTGCFGARDGVLVDNVWAGYTHIHALSTPQWADGIVSAARRYACTRHSLIPVGD
jgi:cobyrinic acid a,c-diamide synthase